MSSSLYGKAIRTRQQVIELPTLRIQALPPSKPEVNDDDIPF